MDDRHCARYLRGPYQYADTRKAARAPRRCLVRSFRRTLEPTTFSSRCSRAAAVLTALLVCCVSAAVAQTVPFYGATVVRFAAAEESRLRLGTRDAFVAAMSEYD